ncbi:MAG: hypothetical protein WCB44_06800, partial [Stellaceae bacterium]
HKAFDALIEAPPDDPSDRTKPTDRNPQCHTSLLPSGDSPRRPVMAQGRSRAVLIMPSLMPL